MTIDGIVHAGLTNIGIRPTFGETETTIETHLLRYSGDLYGRRCGWRSCCGCATSAGSTTWTRCVRRSRPIERRAERLFSRMSV